MIKFVSLTRSEKKKILRKLIGKFVRISATDKRLIKGKLLGLDPENGLVYVKTKAPKKPKGTFSLTLTFEIKDIINIIASKKKKA
jgi:small nuclear ribonucleoprotein (snRNP)-like protein